MKLYFWSALDSIQNYGPGLTFAHAESKEAAIRSIIKSKSGRSDAGYTILYDGRGGRLWKELKATEPEVYEVEFGHFETGSE